MVLSFLFIYRSCLSQCSSVFGLCVLVSPQLCITPAPWACCSPWTVQRRVYRGLWVSSWPLPPPGTLFKKRWLSMFPSQTHLLFRGQDPAEMQYLVWPHLLFLLGFVPYFLILLTFLLLNHSVCAEQASGSVRGRSVQPSVAWWGLYRWQPLTKKAIRYKEESALSLLLRSETVWCNYEAWVCLCAYVVMLDLYLHFVCRTLLTGS